MEKEIIYNENLHFEHKQWQSELAFWEDELKSFTKRLEELVTKWTKKEVLTQLEHFQNEFILQDGIIDKLLEEIEIHESRIAGQSLTGENAIDTVLMKGHLDFRNKMETQRQIYADLKKEFFKFLTKYM
ncbi:hypothetical protein ACOCEA_17595 [Maribacter sp. CXY002]|uniref:hypothetical protein n=1 Tax=Maribacter luteocoastalis TaxID=3407671 RepID=UPI003B677548